MKLQALKFNVLANRCLAALLVVLPHLVLADTPPGWINGNNSSAYTTTRGELALSLAGLKVNDTIDFLDIREDLLAGDRRLEGNSGDLTGLRVTLDYGISDWLSAFYREQRHDLRVDLGEISSVNVLDIDRDLQTTAREAGLKWTFYVADLLNPDGRATAASLELSAFRNKSESFDLVADELRFQNIQLFFQDPRTFSVDQLEDDGWQARVLVSKPLFATAVGSAWLGYRASDASAATRTDIESASIAELFEQAFWLEEDFLTAGFSLNFNLSPIDDLKQLHATTRLTDQSLVALVMAMAAGVQLHSLGNVLCSELLLGWLSIPFTVFATVGVINMVVSIAALPMALS